MRLVKRSISEKDGDGKVVLIAEQSEDMWHAYNLITEGDRVQATTFRKVVKEGATGTSAEGSPTTTDCGTGKRSAVASATRDRGGATVPRAAAARTAVRTAPSREQERRGTIIKFHTSFKP